MCVCACVGVQCFGVRACAGFGVHVTYVTSNGEGFTFCGDVFKNFRVSLWCVRSLCFTGARSFCVFQIGVFVFAIVFVFPFFAAILLAPVLVKRRQITVVVSIARRP